jgi:23S rRNA (adenine2503-C2)-methyltransferase
VVGRGEFDKRIWSRRGIAPQSILADIPDFPRLELRSKITSPVDRFTKLVFRTHDGLPLEAVVIPLEKEGKYTVCLSSQVGCVMGCTFCATARMPTRRNLETWEIVDQFIAAKGVAAERGGQVSGAVFMGMGEPFLNYERVIRAASILCFPVEQAISARAITVSTVGLVDKIDRYTAEAHPYRLSISIGAPTDEKRRELVPVASRYPIKEVAAAAKRYTLSRGGRINIAYVCISGKNIFPDDARALGELFNDTPIRLDLIDVFDTEGRYSPPTASELSTFRDALRHYLGQPVVRRYSGGKDIRAACGTLSGGASSPAP